ncbi:mandelate racemase/muconate lactonizing enzyme family protein [Actinopolymorpha pittospori]|uniref:Galactonate dehydratase n=1 Tax=Actinopolymorpha pittospori TaxID=648752 RepID=A0A927N707_9ACTN|nr:mandelate racemase/muconate lactonizing enzyme family protein [Actinopolymorpha pittospori]MBE1613239.1 galactonate dehydratase [Actinopolymorpha pittospori]
MKPIVIASVEVFPLRLDAAGEASPGRSAYVVAQNRPTIYAAGRETLFVRITSEDGHVGWGEGLAPVAPRVPGAIVEDLLTPALVGADAAGVKPLRHRLGELMRERGHLVGHQADALAAVDIALWDLLGQASGLPVATLLGGAYRRAIPSYVTSVAGATDAERATSIRTLWDGGARRFKLHLGNGVRADLASFDTAHRAAPEAEIAVDVHCVYDLPDALRLGRELQARGAWFLESALPAEYLRGHAELAAGLDLPIAGGEAFRNRFEVSEWLASAALDIVQPDIGRTGITEGDAIATLVNTAYRPILPHHSAALGLALAAGLHVAAAAENAPFFEYGPATVALANTMLAEPILAEPDRLLLPEGPGLGVIVDEERVRALAAAG